MLQRVEDRDKSYRERLRKQNITASQFLDNLTDMFCETIGHMTNEELRDDLLANGVDPDAAYQKVKEILAKHGIKPKEIEHG